MTQTQTKPAYCAQNVSTTVSVSAAKNAKSFPSWKTRNAQSAVASSSNSGLYNDSTTYNNNKGTTMNNHFEIKVPGATVTVMPRSYNYGYKKDYLKSPRMYVRVADESVLDNLANRKRRPYNIYKALIAMSDLSSVLSLSKLSWSQKAGCACGCSPGFVLDHQTMMIAPDGAWTSYFDVWVTLENAPSVDETKPARVLAGL